MKRDWNLIRSMLLAARDGLADPMLMCFEGTSSDVIKRHTELLEQGGFISYVKHYSRDAARNVTLDFLSFSGITEKGVEFCRLFGDDETWNGVKSIFGCAGLEVIGPYEVLRDVALAYLVERGKRQVIGSP